MMEGDDVISSAIPRVFRTNASFSSMGTRRAGEWTFHPKRKLAPPPPLPPLLTLPSLSPPMTASQTSISHGSAAVWLHADQQLAVSNETATFVLFQYYARTGVGPKTVRCEGHLNNNLHIMMMQHARWWCSQSRCCAAYACALQDTTTLHGLPVEWAKVREARSMLARYMRPVVFLDMDAFILELDWCPVWASGSGMLISTANSARGMGAQHANTGFYAVNSVAAGRQIMDTWWGAYHEKVSACWQPGGHCFACREAGVKREHCRSGWGYWKISPNASTTRCCGEGCFWGGECSDQGAYTNHLWPAHKALIRSLGPDFQDTDPVSCAGTVKHFWNHGNHREHAQLLSTDSTRNFAVLLTKRCDKARKATVSLSG